MGDVVRMPTRTVGAAVHAILTELYQSGYRGHPCMLFGGRDSEFPPRGWESFLGMFDAPAFAMAYVDAQRGSDAQLAWAHIVSWNGGDPLRVAWLSSDAERSWIVAGRGGV